MSDERPYLEREQDGAVVRDYVPLRVPADPARDARVAARRAADARKAGIALDHLLRNPSSVYGTVFVELLGDYMESRIHHNCHYDVPSEICPRGLEPGHRHVWQAGRCVADDRAVCGRHADDCRCDGGA